jgi:hypothetical protein
MKNTRKNNRLTKIGAKPSTQINLQVTTTRLRPTTKNPHRRNNTTTRILTTLCHVLQQRTTSIPLHLNRFACLHEIQDKPPIPRWTERTIQFHIAYLQQRKATQNKTSGHATTPITVDKTIHQTPKTPSTRQQYRQHVTTITVPKKANTNTEEPTSTSLVGGRTTTSTTRANTQRPLAEEHLSLSDPITLRPGQRVIVNGKHWILTGNPTLSISQPPEITTIKATQEEKCPTKRNKPEIETEDSSDDSVTTYYKCYIPPDINESNAESVAREEEIQKRIVTRK